MAHIWNEPSGNDIKEDELAVELAQFRAVVIHFYSIEIPQQDALMYTASPLRRW